jgi:hypothetical protein
MSVSCSVELHSKDKQLFDLSARKTRGHALPKFHLAPIAIERFADTRQSSAQWKEVCSHGSLLLLSGWCRRLLLQGKLLAAASISFKSLTRVPALSPAGKARKEALKRKVTPLSAPLSSPLLLLSATLSRPFLLRHQEAAGIDIGEAAEPHEAEDHSPAHSSPKGKKSSAWTAAPLEGGSSL